MSNCTPSQTAVPPHRPVPGSLSMTRVIRCGKQHSELRCSQGSCRCKMHGECMPPRHYMYNVLKPQRTDTRTIRDVCRVARERRRGKMRAHANAVCRRMPQSLPLEQSLQLCRAAQTHSRDTCESLEGQRSILARYMDALALFAGFRPGEGCSGPCCAH